MIEFIIGVLVGFIACIITLAWIGAKAYGKEYRRLQPGDRKQHVWHPNGKECTNGHKWCEEHAAKGKFHCTVCPYVMEQ